jgi:hypothetical protein
MGEGAVLLLEPYVKHRRGAVAQVRRHREP